MKSYLFKLVRTYFKPLDYIKNFAKNCMKMRKKVTLFYNIMVIERV